MVAFLAPARTGRRREGSAQEIITAAAPDIRKAIDESKVVS